MPIFRVTKKVADAIRVTLPEEPIENSNPENEWFADLFYVEGKRCVVWVHRTTLLVFVRPVVATADLNDFHSLFQFAFFAAIAALGLPGSLIGRLDVRGAPSYAPTNDRAVVGSVLDYRKLFEHMVAYEGGLAHANVAAINAALSDTPMSVLAMDSAVDVVRKLVAGELH